MKRYLLLTIIALMFCSSAFSQVSSTKVVRIANATTTFSDPLSEGSILIDLNTDKCYLLLRGIAGTQSLSALVEDTDYQELVSTTLTGDDWGSDVVNTDATITGDGTSGTPLKVDTTVIATKNDLENGTGDLSAHSLTIDSLVYADSYWNDVQVNPYTAKLNASASPEWVSYGGGQILSFDQGDQVYFTVQLPHTYKEGTDLKFHLHVIYTDPTITNDAKWTLTYSWTNVHESGFGTSSLSNVSTYPTSATAGYQDIASIGTLTGTGKKMSSVLICTLTRNSGGGNTASIHVLSMDFHMEMDKPGTDDQF